MTLTATVKGVRRAHGAPQVDVTFLDGASVLDTVSPRDGRAVFKITSLAIGHDRIRVEYGGYAGFGISSSAAIRVAVRSPASKPKVLQISHGQVPPCTRTHDG